MPPHVWLSGINGVIEILPNGSRFSSNIHSSKSSLAANSVIKVLLGISGSVPQPVPIAISPGSTLLAATQVVESLPASNHFQEQYSHLEEILKELIGPIAPTLLRQVAAQASGPQAWVENLMQHLPPVQQIELEQRSNSLLQKSTVQPQTKSLSAPSLKPQAIPEPFVHQCEQALASCIGPIATFLVQKALKSHPQVSKAELIEILVAEIPEHQTAIEFRKRLFLDSND